MNSPAPVLSVSGMNIRFARGGSEVAVVEGLGFELMAGEMVGLVGESGCGKTLSGSALLGLPRRESVYVSADRMLLRGRDLAALDESGWRRVRGCDISMIFQDPLAALDPVFTAGSQMCAVLRRHRSMNRADARRAAAAALASVGLPAGCMQRYPHELSGGMRQRVMVAMALACRPLVLIADEPTTGLDVTTQAQVLQLIRDLARDQGTAVLLITHDLGVVAQVCDRALVMYCGSIVESGPVAELFASPRHPYTAGLLAALPRMDAGPVVPVLPIPGSVPAPGEWPDGCRFSNRCTYADDHCRHLAPALAPGPDGPGRQQFACHHPLPRPQA